MRSGSGYQAGFCFLLICVLACACSQTLSAQTPDPFTPLQATFAKQQQAVLKKYCLNCHNTAEKQGELDLEQFRSVSDLRRNVTPWQRVVEMLRDGEMPPKDAKPQPTPAELASLQQWVQAVLDTEARANAGDPGPVVLRRLNNAEYTYTIQDLTGVPLEPAQEFPVDSAAGEGFTNVGNSLVMSPALIQKYFAAAKKISSHAVLLPDGIEFSSKTTRRDWTNEKLAAIREFYARYTESKGATAVNLQGIQFETNGGGRLPLEAYLQATLKEKEALHSGQKNLASVAREYDLNEKYLTLLWQSLTDKTPSVVLDQIRVFWNRAKPTDAPQLAEMIQQWQSALWRFTTVGHIGKRGGPEAWQVPVQPVTMQQELRLKLPEVKAGESVTLYLATSTAGDGNQGDFALWQNPRLIIPGQPELPLKEVRQYLAYLTAYRERLLAHTAACLNAALEVETATEAVNLEKLAQKHDIEPVILHAWLACLGLDGGQPTIEGYITKQTEQIQNYDFVKGWVGEQALSVVANASDQGVRIPGEMLPHHVAVHPTPQRRVIIGWKSPMTGTVNVKGAVRRAHIGCGNGVDWRLELWRGNTRQMLASGNVTTREASPVEIKEPLKVRTGDMLLLGIGPRDGNHSCDLTDVDLTITPVTAGASAWNLAREISSDILAGNPHADQQGNPNVWHFFSEPDQPVSRIAVPSGSILARWQTEAEIETRKQLAAELQRLLTAGPGQLPENDPDRKLYQQLTSLRSPAFEALRQQYRPNRKPGKELTEDQAYGLDPQLFGKHPAGISVDPSALCVQAPAVIKVRLPAELVAGAEFAATGKLHASTSQQGTVQLKVSMEKPESLTELHAGAFRSGGKKSTWSDGEKPVIPISPVLVSENSQVKERVLAQFAEFRNLFPAALCYTRIVPVDEVVTLTLYYREDEHLQRLMLNPDQTAELNRLWDELHYIGRSPLRQVDAYEQLWQFATQDADPSAFTPMREGIMRQAEVFRTRLQATEPLHIEVVLKFADRAWRRPLSSAEETELKTLYAQLRQQKLSHTEAIQMLLARVLVSPVFLYRTEAAPSGSQPAPVSDHELASRLSYFLWSSLPDQELRELAAQGKLRDPAVLKQQVTRMLQDPRIRRMAIEFGCQWLHVRNFDQFDEKSQRHFPEFAELRSDMYEEVIRFFTDLLQQNRSLLAILDADYVWANQRLAEFYGLQGVAGADWKRVEGVQQQSRGGILAMAATLSKQSGASRTSPILRGNWVSEFLLGEKLPRPPKDVPALPEEVPANLTERQLIEQHSTDPACAKCHKRIDGFGFTLEQFDGIGRLRNQDAKGHPIDDASVLPDGTAVTGISGLRNYLLNERRDDFLRAFNRRLLGYALGRSVQLSDEPLLDQMTTQLKQDDYRITTAIQAIVLSPQFRMIRGAEQQSVSSVTTD